ncbi:hypothetical protein [Enterococcus sp. DIV0691]|uniref:hypothetical protein n=1 Tax=Enterococcus sp. DIV0691 TaxID=2774703 RepID=UPI003F6847D6
MQLKDVFQLFKKLIISEKHLKSALNPILEIRRAAEMWCTGSSPVPSFIPTVRHDLGRVFFVVFFNLNYFSIPPKDYSDGATLNPHFTQKINQ